jgi:transposase-like protein
VRDTLGDEQLVALWRTRETCSDVARRVGVNPTWLRLQWRRLRCNGKIPKDGRRNARVIREDVDDVANDHLDGRPSLKTRDRLLRQLIAVHVEPRFDLFTHSN